MAEPPSDWRPYLGRKVSLRYRLHDDPRPPFSEAIGVVASAEVDARGVERLQVFTRRGQVVSIPVDDIVAAKLFPA